VNDIKVVKVHNAECGKDFGSSTRDHSKSSIHNLFMNFKKSHLMSVVHIKNWCQKKGIRFEDHLQSQAGKGKTVVLTLADHKRLVLDGIEILDALNEDIGREKKTFDVIRDLNSEEVQSF
jgi:hypothetical protein